MSEVKTREVEIIPKDAVIDIKVSFNSMQRILLLLTDFFPYKDTEHFAQLVKHVKEGTNQEDKEVFHFTTLVSLYTHLEEQAKAQGKTKMILVNAETGEPIEEQTPPAPPSESQPQ